jgi:hypothetical protein
VNPPLEKALGSSGDCASGKSVGSSLERKVEVKIEVHLEGSAVPIRTKVADLTLGGCFVEMMFTLDIGTKLNIALWINDIKVSAEGIVVTRLRNLGNGIQFTKLAAEDQARLKQFLKWPQLVREDP